MKPPPAKSLGIKHKQGGFLLPQAAILVLIIGLVSAYAGQQYWMKNVNERRDGAARLVGGRMAAVNDATKTYATTFFTQIQRGQSVTRNGYTLGSNNVLSPSLSDLSGLGFLPPSGASPVVYNGQAISFTVQMRINTESGCTIPTCNLQFQVTTTAPLLTPGSQNVDVRRATLAATVASSSNAGVSLPASMGGDPSVFVTNGGTQVGSNPGGVAGLLSVSNGYDSSGFMEFDRRDGSLPRTGSINMQDTAGAKHDVNNAGAINAETVKASGRITAGEYLQLDGAAVDGNDCAPNGLWGRDANGPLFCGEGKWKKPGGWEFQLIQGVCQAPYKGGTTCPLGDTTWKSCSLTGAFGVGDSETGSIYRNANGWYLATSRLTWPGVFYWSCFK
ncbi:shufflon system plasmid conjugative transfer pilus tip adhesin PilV [Pseudomonas sp. F1002]|uniref:shufflon system plasmid conjugative transfer pilus tip adhesin PilV n=1 Tax=Pseudomonas sp. F1002 TaxID=2738821 RepID=UPI00210E5C02|nr:shufflon system plasmid conjugative transfer pilus tip adhesin PilV [Pseudomonas sp. F1002]